MQRITNFQTLEVSVAPVVDTNVYADGDLLFVPTVVELLPAGHNVAEPTGKLRFSWVKTVVVDAAGQNADFDLFLVPANTTWGTINVAASPALAVLQSILAWIRVGSYATINGDGVALAVTPGIPFEVEMTNAAIAVYAVAIARGTPTFAAAGNLTLKLTFVAENFSR